MRKSDELRRERIAEAAYTLIRERGYRRASLLEIAKSAGVSNQTMYRWYGSKRGLFGALIEANATRAAAAIDQALVDASRPEDALREVALLVLRTVTSDRAVDLNRAAAADASDTGELGAALARAGRDLIIPRVASLVERAHQRGDLTAPDAAAAAEMWVSLVIGDLQIRVVTGAIPTPPDDELRRRAATGCLAFLFLYAPSTPITIGEPS
ncbi:TetR/AcrR family transcriptional regulator [Microbacterium aurum]